MNRQLSRCDRCRGQLFYDPEDRQSYCLQCGYRPYPPGFITLPMVIEHPRGVTGPKPRLEQQAS